MNIQVMKQKLKDFNKVRLGLYPTPLERLSTFEKEYGLSNIYMKRDDLNQQPGGNKIRHLEYVLSDMKRKNKDIFVLPGPLQSNFCTLAALCCRKANIPCILIHNGEKPSKLEGNDLLINLLGVKQIFLGKVDEYERARYAEKYKLELVKKGLNPYMFLGKEAHAIASLGYIEGIIELYEQVQNKGYIVKDIFVPGGTGLFASGVIFGAAVLNLQFHVHVVTVEYEKEDLYKKLKDKLVSIAQLLGIDFNYNVDEIMTVHEGYQGAGWGCSTPESINVIRDLAKTEAIFLEKIYTSKGFYGMTDLLRKGVVKSVGACYIHSGGFTSIFNQF